MTLSSPVPIPAATNAGPVQKLVFRLYVGGTTPASTRAMINTRRLCAQFGEDNCRLEILDIRENLVLARQDQVLAIPTLVRLQPMPARRFIGDLSETGPVLRSLGLDAGSLAPATAKG